MTDGSCFFCEDYTKCQKIKTAWTGALFTCPPGVPIEQHRKKVLDELRRTCQAEKKGKIGKMEDL
ncbi:MAG: hypothetical protein LUO93_02405 [Methanomicrobiales archaeon]|nr:hypothetical protein [Methanomicrobiales archaeon]